VRIHNTNTGKIIVAEFSLIDGKAAVHGDFALDGVAGLGDAITLAFQAPGGATTGKLLPSGRVLDMIAVEGLGEVEVSLVDAANPTVFVQADAFGLSAREAPDALSRDTVRLGQLENLRIGAAVAMGLVREPQEARTTLRNLPLVALVASPVDTVSLKGDTISAASLDIVTRMISSGQPHKATPLTGAMCLAVAARIPGSVVAQCARPTTGDIRIGSLRRFAGRGPRS
jgi:2-methylaconitate cis-trans-isomerase PrpF